MGKSMGVALVLVAALLAGFASGGRADPTPAPAESASPQASPSPTPVVAAWLGVALGDSSKQVRAALGKPLDITATSVGDLWRYDADHGNATLEIIVDQDQVLNIAARAKSGKQSALADPLGGSLGMSAQALQAARGTPIATYDNGDSLAYGDVTGVRWFYTLDSGTVTSIEVSRPLPPPAAPQIEADAYHDGSTITRALLVKADSESDATTGELAYLRKLSCDNGGGAWTLGTQEVVSAGGRFFDLYHVTCSSSKQPHDFYFDVTDSFGK
jgi:hypothetical protein